MQTQIDKLEAENKALLADVAALREGLQTIQNYLLGQPYTWSIAVKLLAAPNPGQALLDECRGLVEDARCEAELQAAHAKEIAHERDTLAAENARLEAMVNAAGWFLQPIPPRNWSEENARLRERLEAAENILEQCFFKAECTYGGYTEVAIKTYLAKYATPKEPTDA
jgi:hypothetical protein